MAMVKEKQSWIEMPVQLIVLLVHVEMIQELGNRFVKALDPTDHYCCLALVGGGHPCCI